MDGLHFKGHITPLFARNYSGAKPRGEYNDTVRWARPRRTLHLAMWRLASSR